MRPKGVIDGQQVNIPVLGVKRLTEGVTEKDSRSGCWLSRFKQVGGQRRQIRAAIKHRDVMTSRKTKFVIPCFQEKLRRKFYINPYRKPTQVDRMRILRRLDEL